MRILHVGDDFAALRPCGLTLYSDALMQAQKRAGHDVSYVFSGRHYPKLDRPRLKRWNDRGVRMFELVGSPIQGHWENGTRYPLRDLDEAAGEAAFAAALREARPEIVHVQELARLPSSVIEMAKAEGLPVVMTLHDYKPVCASVRLLDSDHRRCTRHDVGADCARNCAGAPAGRAHLIDLTVDYELDRAKRAVPLGTRIDYGKLAPVVGAVKRLGAGGAASDARPAPAPDPPGAPPAEYQRRRDVNLERLNLCDRLITPSARVSEIYAELGVEPGRLSVQRLTLPHLEGMAPRGGPEVRSPLTFVTLSGCASPAKGSRVIVDAVQALERAGHDYRLLVLGHVEPFALRELSQVASVRLGGRYTPDDLGELLDGTDVGLLPSIWEESHGFVGIEMLAHGLPLIANALGGIPEYVDDGETGWLTREATGAELARLIAAAIADPAMVESARRKVRGRRERIVRPIDEHTAEVEGLYAELVSRPPRQAETMRSPSVRRSAS